MHSTMLKTGALNELKQIPHWAVWHDKDKKIKDKTFRSKSPFQASNPNRPASSTKYGTWGTYEQAAKAVADGRAHGIGFMLSEDDPYCGIDFDHVCNGDRVIRDDVLAEVKSLNTYAEYSQSGTGVHAVGKAVLPSGSRHKGNGVEIYDRDRFFIFTGDRITGTRAKINDVDPNSILLKIRGSADNVSAKNSGLGPPSRHDALVSMAASMVASGAQPEFIEQAIWAKARELGLPDREGDGKEVERIIKWAVQPTSFENQVARVKHNKRVNRQADIDLASELVKNELDYTDSETGEDEEAKPDEDVQYMVEGLIPASGNVLLNAVSKVGKTSLGLTLLKSLCDESPFLNNYNVQCKRRVCYFNYEVPPGMFRRWLRKADIKNKDRYTIRNVRGASAHFWLPEHQEAMIEYFQRMDIGVWILDPQMMAVQGLVTDENDNMQFAQWHHAIDTIKEVADIDVAFVIHHMGKSDNSKARGASRIEDWPDAIWSLKLDEKTNARTFKAVGRDVDVHSIALTFDEQTQLYAWDGISATELKALDQFKDFAKAIRGYYMEHKIWPKIKDARKTGFCPVGANRKAEFISEFEGRGYAKRVEDESGPGRRIQLTDTGVRLTT